MTSRKSLAGAITVGVTLDWRRHVWPITALIGAILLANVIALTGFYHDDPALFVSNLATSVKPGPIPGFPNWLDPNIGYTTQALGYRAAQDWLRGVVPWWDPYQGVGAPLAAELQNGGFFLPFSLLLHFSTGWLLLRLLMQCLAGCFTYALLIQLRLSRQAALLGGAMFGCSSSFIILADAPSYTFPFLPLLLFGIERGLASDRRFDPGWSSVIIAVAYSFYAGFPETGFLADMLGGLWFTVRISEQKPENRLRGARNFTIAVSVGLVLALPGLIPFVQYMLAGDIGIHAASSAVDSLPILGLTLQVVPYSFGPMGAYWASAKLDPGEVQNLVGNWLNTGGWIGFTPITLSFFGLFVPNNVIGRARWLLIFWILVVESGIFGLPFVVNLIDLVAPLRLIELRRYAEPSVNFAVILFAAFGLDNWLRRGFSITLWRFVFSMIFVFFAASLAVGALIDREIFVHSMPLFTLELLYIMCEIIAATGLIILFSQTAVRLRRLIASLIIMVDCLLGFSVSQTAGVTSGQLDLSGVAYLRQHQGLQRSFSLGPLAPNYGSRYRVAQLNMTMLPMPRNWADYIRQSLDPFGDPITFMGYNNTAIPGVASMARLLRDNLPAYRSLGVRYILANPETNPLHTTQKPVFT
ncbi:MAG: hypothetical protein POG24_07475 [Acidocella sp.]|nr:hypothetical protein [Acidocella sp.]